MQVLLKKEGLFSFDETKYTKIPNDVFDAMVSTTFNETKSKTDNVESEMFYFKSMRDYDDYNYNHNQFNDVFDKTKGVFVTQKGEVFVFKNTKITVESNEKINKTDVTTNTKENTTTKS